MGEAVSRTPALRLALRLVKLAARVLWEPLNRLPAVLLVAEFRTKINKKHDTHTHTKSVRHTEISQSCCFPMKRHTSRRRAGQCPTPVDSETRDWNRVRLLIRPTDELLKTLTVRSSSSDGHMLNFSDFWMWPSGRRHLWNESTLRDMSCVAIQNPHPQSFQHVRDSLVLSVCG